MALVLVAAVAMPAAARGGASPRGRGMGRGGSCMGPQFTTEQQDQIKKIHDKYDAKRVELSNRLDVLQVEMQDLVAAKGEPDFKAIEKKMEDISAVRLDLSKLRLRIHQDVRPLLTDDQKTLFDSRLGLGMMHGMRGGFGGPGHMRNGGMRAGRMGGAMMGQVPGGMGGCAMMGQAPGGMNGGMNPGPYCRFRTNAPDDDAENDD